MQIQQEDITSQQACYEKKISFLEHYTRTLREITTLQLVKRLFYS